MAILKRTCQESFTAAALGLRHREDASAEPGVLGGSILLRALSSTAGRIVTTTVFAGIVVTGAWKLFVFAGPEIAFAAAGIAVASFFAWRRSPQFSILALTASMVCAPRMIEIRVLGGWIHAEELMLLGMIFAFALSKGSREQVAGNGKIRLHPEAGEGKTSEQKFNPWIAGAIFLASLALSLSTISGAFFGTIASPSNAFVTLARIVELMIILLLAASIPWTSRNLTRLRAAFVIFALIMAAYGILCYVVRTSREETVSRIFLEPPFDHESNHFAGLFALAIVCVLFSKNEPWRGFAARIPAAMVLGFALWLCASRGALFAISVTIFLLGLTRVARKSILAAAGIVLIAALAVLALLQTSISFPRPLSADIEATEYQKAREEIGYVAYPGWHRNRLTVWEELGREFEIAPVIGVGVGAREKVHYENFFLWSLSELGIVGSALLLGALACLLRGLGANGGPPRGMILLALLLGITSVSFLIFREGGPLLVLIAATSGAGNTSEKTL
ncbi:MAG: hypothetical protein NUW37_16080 [Planctomycetes bacterium]|nr:hypothetical protein [Planctomycetota bacterium]